MNDVVRECMVVFVLQYPQIDRCLDIARKDLMISESLWGRLSDDLIVSDAHHLLLYRLLPLSFHY
jgi:hypothetical protein